VYDTLQQLSHTLVSTKKLVQYLAIYGNLVLGHPLQPPVGFVDQLNHYQEGDGPSYCYAILILEFTPSYRTLLSMASNSRAMIGWKLYRASRSARSPAIFSSSSTIRMRYIRSLLDASNQAGEPKEAQPRSVLPGDARNPWIDLTR